MDSNIKNIFKKPSDVKKDAVLNPADLLRHAAAIIRFDKESALNSQKNVYDLVAPSNDSESKRPTSLENLTSNRGSVTITDKSKNNSAETAAPKNLVSFSSQKMDS